MKGFIRGSLWLIGIVGAICLLLHVLFFDTWVVPDSDALLVTSVLPTLYPNDRILTARRSNPTSGSSRGARRPSRARTTSSVASWASPATPSSSTTAA